MLNRKIWIIAVPILIMISIGILSLMNFDSPEMGRAVLSAAGRATELELNADQFQLNVLKGLSLKNVTAEGELFERSIDAQLASLALQHRILPLLKGNFSVKRISIIRPQIDCIELVRGKPRTVPERTRKGPEAKPPASSPTPESVEKNLLLEISNVGIENAQITFRRKKDLPPTALIKGLNVKLIDFMLATADRPLFNGLSARGEFQADEMHVGDTKIHKSEGDFDLHKGLLRVSKARFTTKQGNFTVRLEMNLKSSPLQYNMDLEGDPLDTNAILGGNGQGSYGPSKLQLKGAGIGPDSANFNADGTFALSQGTLPSSEALAAIEWMIGKTKLVGAKYKTSATPFKVYENKVRIDHFLLELEQASLQLSGLIYLDGPLSMRLDVKAPRQNVKIKEVPNEVVDSLTDDAGWVSIPFQVRGTSREPNVYLDTQALFAQAGQGAVKVIKKKLKDKLQDLLNKQ